MQVFGPQGSIYRGARLTSRLAAQTSDIAAVRRDALRRSDQAYAATAAARGDPTESLVLEGAGHFEVIDPTSAVWPRIVDAFAELLRRRPHPALATGSG